MLSYRPMRVELTAAQVAARLEVGRSTVNLWCRQGRFPGARVEVSPVGDYWLIPERDLEDFTPPKRGAPKKPKAGDAAPNSDGRAVVKTKRTPRKGRK